MNRGYACLSSVPLTLLLALSAEAALTSAEAVEHESTSLCEKSAAFVAEFLELSQEPLQNTERLLVERHQLAVPLQQQISVLNQKLEVLLEAGGSAEDIGHLLLEIHGRHQALESIQADFLSQFVGQLVGEQRARYAAAHRAESLRPILPAFRRLRLF